MACVVELWAPPDMLAAASRALRSLGAGVALALAADGIQRGVRAADEMEPVTHDPGVGQRRPDRMPVGVRRVDRDDLDPSANLCRQCRHPPLDDLSGASRDHVDHTTAIQIRDHGRELPTAAMMRLVKRQTTRWPVLATGEQFVAAEPERRLDLVAARVLIARHLSMRATALATVKQMLAKPGADPLARRQRRMGLGERPRARLTPEPPLAPTQVRHPSREREIPDPHPVSLLDHQRPTTTPPTAPRPSQHLDLELDPPTMVSNSRHRHALDPDKTANVVIHPLFLLVRVFDNAKPARSSGCLLSGPQPR